MRFLTGFLIVFGGLCAAFPSFAEEDISAAARKIAANKAELQRLSKNDVKTGQTVADIGNLSIDDFLELDAVPDGTDVVSADSFYRADESFSDFTTKQAVESVKAMRRNGIDLPEDLEQKIQSNPEKASELMMEAFSAIAPSKAATPDEAKAIRRKTMRKVENALGIPFKSLLEKQRKEMTELKQ